MMEKLKMLLLHTMMITFGIVVGMTLEGLFFALRDDPIDFQWYHLASVVVTGFLCSLPSLFLERVMELPKRQYHIGVVIHCLSLFVIVMLLGYLFHWYRHLNGMIFTAIIFVVVYAFVWAASMWLGTRDEKKINDVLDQIRDED